jgi:hypothetical protein
MLLAHYIAELEASISVPIYIDTRMIIYSSNIKYISNTYSQHLPIQHLQNNYTNNAKNPYIIQFSHPCISSLPYSLGGSKSHTAQTSQSAQTQPKLRSR